MVSRAITPDRLSVPALTSLSTCLTTGNDSPVNNDSSIVVSPQTITPSTGIFSPGKTCIHSPTLTCSTGISIPSIAALTPALIKRAIGGWSFNKDSSAKEALCLALDSRVRPKRINPNNITGSSKKHSHPKEGNRQARQLAM